MLKARGILMVLDELVRAARKCNHHKGDKSEEMSQHKGITTLEYTLNLKKCSLLPSTSDGYLGFIVDSEKQAYLSPDDKKVAVSLLQDQILRFDYVSVNTLQMFAGKCLAIPAARLYSRKISSAIAQGLYNMAVLYITWENQGCKDPALNIIMKRHRPAHISN
ncbi:LOW QUALITY PROTEIN: uncharacterized protein LOC135462953 [Liolophura sinensis]|uniref:LOW QUALITY PROTEIN: uncharacterized protein LOC135462953 n=1 Tax=Liolophura sinensis TaxID=3198878 RepID=UPI00315935F6